MKTITITLIIILLFSCRTYKEKVQQESRSTTLTEESKTVQHRYQWLQQDSQNRQWYFWTDSTFTYHPDSGLRATSGFILVTETASGSSSVESNAYLSEDHSTKEETYESLTTSKALHRGSSYFFIGGGILFVLLIVYLYVKFFK
ncbi:hypothetical protein [Sphingobacterium sp. LRF_L2]|uniref:hypothetical protein n=1 Tax=Sphingobacterium sp. LRF_L2 TaxID=3369421 RepID=UPI003F60D524